MNRNWRKQRITVLTHFSNHRINQADRRGGECSRDQRRTGSHEVKQPVIVRRPLRLKDNLTCCLLDLLHHCFHIGNQQFHHYLVFLRCTEETALDKRCDTEMKGWSEEERSELRSASEKGGQFVHVEYLLVYGRAKNDGNGISMRRGQCVECVMIILLSSVG